MQLVNRALCIDPGIGIAPIENDLVDHIKDPLYDGPQKAGGYQVMIVNTKKEITNPIISEAA